MVKGLAPKFESQALDRLIVLAVTSAAVSFVLVDPCAASASMG
jgi:hypothetical protein